MQTFHIPDMTCGHCVAAITESVRQADSAATLQFEREAQRVQIASVLSRQALSDVLTEAGYPPAAGN